VHFPWRRVGMITAQYLGADAVVVPISCNDGIDSGLWQPCFEPKTKIGSRTLIAGMSAARAEVKRHLWMEANGGFLLGSDVTRVAACSTALPTRDAFCLSWPCFFRGRLVARLPSCSRFARNATAVLRCCAISRVKTGKRIIQLLTCLDPDQTL